jgi:hypothetical protein
MNRTIRSLSRIGAVLVMSAVTTASAAPIVIDDFDNDTLNPAYVQSKVVAAGTAPTSVYDTTTNTDKLTWSYTSANSSSGNQYVLLRNDYQLLNDGDWVQITATLDLVSGTTATGLYGGIAVGLTSATDRNNMFSVYVRSNGNVSVLYNNAGTITAPDIATGVFPSMTGPSVSIPLWLRITRVSDTSVAASYSTDGTTFSSGTSLASYPISSLSAATMGVGVFDGNAINNRKGTVIFDNLTLDVVPEPSAIALSLLGLLGLGLAGLRKRK